VRTWVELKASPRTPVALYEDALYLADSNALVHAIGTSVRIRSWRGEERTLAAWSYLRLAQPLPIPPPPPPTVPRIWTRALGAPPSALAVDERFVYVGTQSGLQALDRLTGESSWSLRMGEPVTALLVDERQVVASTASGQLHLIDSHAGTGAAVPSSAKGHTWLGGTPSGVFGIGETGIVCRLT
jgi:hypothetical protein